MNQLSFKLNYVTQDRPTDVHYWFGVLGYSPYQMVSPLTYILSYNCKL